MCCPPGSARRTFPYNLACHATSPCGIWPWNGGTNGQQNLASTTDVTAPDWKLPSVEAGPRPLGDVSYLGMDAQYNVLQSVPKRGEPAPAHFLIPDLRSALWYRTAPDQRDGDARQFFDLVGCNGS